MKVTNRLKEVQSILMDCVVKLLYQYNFCEPAKRSQTNIINLLWPALRETSFNSRELDFWTLHIRVYRVCLYMGECSELLIDWYLPMVAIASCSDLRLRAHKWFLVHIGFLLTKWRLFVYIYIYISVGVRLKFQSKHHARESNEFNRVRKTPRRAKLLE